MATYQELDRADLARHSSNLCLKAQAAEMALFLVDGLRDYMKCPDGTLRLARRTDVDEHAQ